MASTTVEGPTSASPARSGLPPRLTSGATIFQAICDGDLLLHHPFESFAPVIDMLRQAAADPQVLAIKQTLYRTGPKSLVVDTLVDAARRGKEVTVVVELRARFDEEANIALANRLQEAGAHVVYGVVGYKTHAKMLLVVRRENGHLRNYVHLGTGNYHAGTARLYADFGLLTNDVPPVRVESFAQQFGITFQVNAAVAGRLVGHLPGPGRAGLGAAPAPGNPAPPGPLFRPSTSTFEPTKHEPNVPNVNTIPGEDVFYFDCRVLPVYKTKEVVAAVQALADQTAQTFGVKVVLEATNQESSPPTATDAPIVRELLEVLRRVRNLRAKPVGIGGGTVAGPLREEGFPCVVWSTTDETGHTVNEYAKVDNLVADPKVFAALMAGPA